MVELLLLRQEFRLSQLVDIVNSWTQKDSDSDSSQTQPDLVQTISTMAQTQSQLVQTISSLTENTPAVSSAVQTPDNKNLAQVVSQLTESVSTLSNTHSVLLDNMTQTLTTLLSQQDCVGKEECSATFLETQQQKSELNPVCIIMHQLNNTKLNMSC